jgi:ELWxxDGT repeat protein
MSRCLRWIGLFLASYLIPAWAAFAAGPPRMVADLNTQPVNGNAFPQPYTYLSPEMAELGGVLYFAATDPMHGLELWRSDGTPGGTRLVRDIHPGPAGSGLLSLTVHQGRLYFFADDGVWGLELWSSDGTREGTRLVRDLCPGLCQWGYSGRTVPAGSRLYLATGWYGEREIWWTDGTREGTHHIANPCSDCFEFFDGGFAGLPNGRILFTAYHAGKGRELWMSDGTPQGTLGLDLLPGANGSSPSAFIVVGDRAFFWAFDESSVALWSSDGTAAGTRVVQRDVTRPATDSGPVVWNGSLYWADIAGDLWRTDPASGQTVRLATFETTPNPYESRYRPVRLTPMPDRLLFLAGDSARGKALWQTRGTPETTGVLTDPVPGAASPDLAGLHRAGNRAFFVARTVNEAVGLWTTDGTAQGTRRIRTLCRDADGCFSADWRDFRSVGGLSCFILRLPFVGGELWRSDGSAAGTFLLRDIHKGAGSAVSGEIAALDGLVLFGASTAAPAAGPAALWSSDGTAAGTVPVDGEAHWPQGFLGQGDHLYFSGARLEGAANSPYLRRQGLWRTDGTPLGTERLASGLFDLDLLALDGGLVFLRARDDESGQLGTGVELWRSDGTSGGTRQVVDLDQQLEVDGLSDPPLVQPGSSRPGPLVRLGPVLLYAADDGLTGRELWATDGTEEGTRKVRDINQQDENPSGSYLPGTSEPGFLVRLGGVVLFAADDGLAGRELWVTDGTETGTRLLRDLRLGAEGSSPHHLVELGGAVYFFASADGNGEALWRSDGTEAGTVQVKSLVRQGLPSWGRDLTPAGDRLFFVADNEAIGPELHVSDGTLAGTRLVRQIRAGANGSYPQSFTVVDGVLFFTADDGAHGLEPWRSDGTAAGTRPLGDLAPGQAASAPSAFTDAGSLLFFAADDGRHGRELWAIPLDDATTTGAFP